ncbi:MAG: hypothetical protein WDW36_000085 [Sanguina aurantia]
MSGKQLLLKPASGDTAHLFAPHPTLSSPQSPTKQTVEHVPPVASAVFRSHTRSRGQHLGVGEFSGPLSASDRLSCRHVRLSFPQASELHTASASTPPQPPHKQRTAPPHTSSSAATAAAAAAAAHASEKVLHAFNFGKKASSPQPPSSAAAAAAADPASGDGSPTASSSSGSASSASQAASQEAHGESSSGPDATAPAQGAATADTGGAGGSSGSSTDSSSSAGEQQQQQQQGSTGGGSAGSSSSGSEKAKSAGVKAAEMLRFVSKEVSDTLLGVQNVHSATAAYMGERAPEVGEAEAGGPSALVLVVPVLSPWQKGMGQFRERLSKLPFLSKLAAVDVSATAPYKRGVELAEGLKDRWETSDHPVVHKVEDVKARYFSGSDASKAMAEIRSRDPSFDMNSFVQSVKLDAPGVSKAFLRHDLPVLKQHCGPELIQRFQGIFKHFAEQGLFEDPTILFVGDVEIVEVRMLDDDPFIIAQFHCQQLKCTRDAFGNVVDGSSQTIQRVYYFWGMAMEKERVVTADGQLLPPRWVIKDMMWQSMLALV